MKNDFQMTNPEIFALLGFVGDLDSGLRIGSSCTSNTTKGYVMGGVGGSCSLIRVQESEQGKQNGYDHLSPFPFIHYFIALFIHSSIAVFFSIRLQNSLFTSCLFDISDCTRVFFSSLSQVQRSISSIQSHSSKKLSKQ